MYGLAPLFLKIKNYRRIDFLIWDVIGKNNNEKTKESFTGFNSFFIYSYFRK